MIAIYILIVVKLLVVLFTVKRHQKIKESFDTMARPNEVNKVGRDGICGIASHNTDRYCDGNAWVRNTLHFGDRKGFPHKVKKVGDSLRVTLNPNDGRTVDIRKGDNNQLHRLDDQGVSWHKGGVISGNADPDKWAMKTGAHIETKPIAGRYNWTHMPWTDNRNYIRGDGTVVDNAVFIRSKGRMGDIKAPFTHQDRGLHIQNKNGKWTHFAWNDNNNYIRGTTIFDNDVHLKGPVRTGGNLDVHGNTNSHHVIARGNADIRGYIQLPANGKICFGNNCIDSKWVTKFKNPPKPTIIKQAPPPPPPKPYCIFYEHSNGKGGSTKRFGHGKYPNWTSIYGDNWWNDRVSSVRVGPKTSVKIYKHDNFNHHQMTIVNSNSQGEIVRNMGHANDDMSSFIVESL